MGPNQAKNMPGQRSALHSSLNTSHITSQTKTVIPIMNIQFRIHGLNANAGLRRWLEQQLERFHSLIPVSAAEVLLERERDAAPGFRAHVHLAVPGRDIHAAARDHTLEGAEISLSFQLGFGREDDAGQIEPAEQFQQEQADGAAVEILERVEAQEPAFGKGEDAPAGFEETGGSIRSSIPCRKRISTGSCSKAMLWATSWGMACQRRRSFSAGDRWRHWLTFSIQFIGHRLPHGNGLARRKEATK